MKVASLYDANRHVVAKATARVRGVLHPENLTSKTLPPIVKKEELKRVSASASTNVDNLTVLYTASTPGGMKQKQYTLQPNVLNPLEKLPINLKWEKLARSRFVEDETVLRHIPYVGDDDGTFINDLYENYDSAMVFDEAQEEENKLTDKVIKKIVETCLRDMPDIACREVEPEEETESEEAPTRATVGGSQDAAAAAAAAAAATEEPSAEPHRGRPVENPP